MLEIVAKYWLQFLLTCISGGLTALCKHFYNSAKKEREAREKERKEESERQKLLEEAVRAILHDRLIQSLSHFLSVEEINDVEHDNILVVYNAYVGLGGNGTVKRLYERFDERVKVVPASVKFV